MPKIALIDLDPTDGSKTMVLVEDTPETRRIIEEVQREIGTTSYPMVGKVEEMFDKHEEVEPFTVHECAAVACFIFSW